MVVAVAGDEGLYIVLVSLHGLIRGREPELGRDAIHLKQETMDAVQHREHVITRQRGTDTGIRGVPVRAISRCQAGAIDDLTGIHDKIIDGDNGRFLLSDVPYLKRAPWIDLDYRILHGRIDAAPFILSHAGLE